MEFASLLAGERWSDHPACTHPLLAAVARHVNDYTTDAGRPQLATLIPSVIGLTGDDLHIDARIALGSATMALPVVAAERQRVMAVSVLTCERLLAGLDGRPAGSPPGAERHGPGARAPRRTVGLPIHQRPPDVHETLSPSGRSRDRPPGRSGHRTGLRAGPPTRCSATSSSKPWMSAPHGPTATRIAEAGSTPRWMSACHRTGAVTSTDGMEPTEPAR